MAKQKPKKAEQDPEAAATFHGDLTGFDIKVNTFGEMESTIDMDQLNAFLNRKMRLASDRASAGGRRGEVPRTATARRRDILASS